MTKEQKYIAALQQLGVYNPAFDPVIHQLCKLEREEGRADKAWRATAAEGKAPLATDPAYDALQRIRQAILQHWDLRRRPLSACSGRRRPRRRRGSRRPRRR